MRRAIRTDELYDFDYEFYDVLFEDFTDDLELIRSLAKETGGPILELMSGTGRVLLPLAREGYEVWGLDINENMIAKLNSKLANEPKEVQERVHLVKGDVRGFRIGRRFRLIFVTLNSFLHLITPGDQEACLNAVREHLEPSGRFFNAFLNPDPNRPGGGLKLSKVAKVENGEIMWLESRAFELPSKSTAAYFIYDLLGPEGNVKRCPGQTTLRLIFRQEMEHLLDRCGLEVIRIMGGYDGRPFDKDSPMQIYVCRRTDAKI